MRTAQVFQLVISFFSWRADCVPDHFDLLISQQYGLSFFKTNIIYTNSSSENFGIETSLLKCKIKSFNKVTVKCWVAIPPNPTERPESQSNKQPGTKCIKQYNLMGDVISDHLQHNEAESALHLCLSSCTVTLLS